MTRNLIPTEYAWSALGVGRSSVGRALAVSLVIMAAAASAGSAEAATGVWTPVGPFISPVTRLAIDRSGGRVAVESTQGSYLSSDRGASWGSLPDVPLVGGIVAIDPSDADILIADDGRRSYRSTDAGATFVSTLDRADSAISVAVYDAATPHALYETDLAGIARSLDQGATWTRLPAMQATVHDIAAGPSGGQVVAATEIGPQITNDGGDTWDPLGSGLIAVSQIARTADAATYAAGLDGVWRLAPAGQSWVRVAAPAGGGPIADIAAAGASLLVVTADGRLLRSTTAGASWADVTLPVGARRALNAAIAPSNPQRQFVGTDGGLLVSSDAGQSWTLRVFEHTGAVARDVATAPARPGQVWALTSGAFAFGSRRAQPVIYRSPDAGATWLPVAGPQTSDEIVELQLSRTGFGTAAYVATETNLYRSDDAGVHWELVSRPPDGAAAFARVDPFDGDHVLWPGAPVQELLSVVGGLWQTTDGGAHWARSPITGYAIIDIAFHPRIADLVWITAHGATSQWRTIRSTDGGTTATTDYPGSPAAPDAAGPVAAFAGVTSTRDAGATWHVPFHVPPVIGGQPTHALGSTVGTWLVGDENGLIASRDAGRTWHEAGGGLGLHGSGWGSGVGPFALDWADPTAGWLATRAGIFHRSFDSAPTRAVLDTVVTAPLSVRPGDFFSASATITNHGPDTFRGGSITIDGTRGVRSAAGCTGIHYITCPLGPLAVGASATISIVARCTANAAFTSVSAGADSDPTTIAYGGAGDSEQTLCPLAAGPVIATRVTTRPRLIKAGGSYTTTTTVRNVGSVPVGDVRFEVDAFNEQVATIHRTTTGTSCPAQTLLTAECTITNFAAGAEATVTSTATGFRGQIGQDASYILVPNALSPYDLTFTRVSELADLTVSLDRGDTTTIARIANRGPSPARAVQVRITPPAGSLPPRVSPPAGAECVTAATITCWLFPLRGSAALAITSKAPGLRVTVQSITEDPAPVNNSATLAALPAPASAAITIGPRTQRISPTRRVSVRVTCTSTAACVGAFAVRTRSRVRVPDRPPRVHRIGGARFSLRPGSARTYRLKLTIAMGRLLRQRGTLTLNVQSELRRPNGTKLIRVTQFTVRRR